MKIELASSALSLPRALLAVATGRAVAAGLPSAPAPATGAAQRAMHQDSDPAVRDGQGGVGRQLHRVRGYAPEPTAARELLECRHRQVLRELDWSKQLHGRRAHSEYARS